MNQNRNCSTKAIEASLRKLKRDLSDIVKQVQDRLWVVTQERDHISVLYDRVSQENFKLKAKLNKQKKR